MATRSRVWPDPRVKPPWGGAYLNREHPLAQGMVLCLPMTERGSQLLTDVSGSRSVKIQDSGGAMYSTPWQTSARGVGPVIGARSPDRMLKLAPDVSIPANASFSDFFLVDVTAFTGGNPGLWRSSSGTDTFHIFQGGGGGNRVWVRGGGAELLVPGSGSAISLGLHSEGITNINATSCTEYLDGVAVQTNAHATATASCAFNLIGVQGGALSGELLEGRYLTVYFWLRALTSSEYRWLHAEPYAMLSPVVHRRYFVPSAAAGGSIPVKDHHYRMMRPT